LKTDVFNLRGILLREGGERRGLAQEERDKKIGEKTGLPD
jgi:hypothetical protein